MRPGVMEAVFAEVEAQIQVRGSLATEAVGSDIVAQAKRNASVAGRHARGTKTPASPGSGPAMISGTLRNAITRTAPKFEGDAWVVQVYVAAKRPPYGTTTADVYGAYLEKLGLRNGVTYPFLGPAGVTAGRAMAPVQFLKEFRGGWRTFG